MDERITSEMLEEEIRNQIDDLSDLEAGSMEKSKAINDLAVLYRLKIDESKVKLEADEKHDRLVIDAEQHDADNALKEKQMNIEAEFKDSQLKSDEYQKASQLVEQERARYFSTAVGIVEIVVPLIFYAYWMRKGFKFEETGAYTSGTFRNLYNRFKPTRK